MPQGNSDRSHGDNAIRLIVPCPFANPIEICESGLILPINEPALAVIFGGRSGGLRTGGSPNAAPADASNVFAYDAVKPLNLTTGKSEMPLPCSRFPTIPQRRACAGVSGGSVW